MHPTRRIRLPAAENPGKMVPARARSARRSSVPRRVIVLAVCLVLAAAPPGFAWPAARPDAYGDPLPDGALARLGTARFGAYGAAAASALAADGNVLAVSLERSHTLVLDAATGRELCRLNLP